MGRPSIAPEKLLRAMLLQAFYEIRSERQLMERLEFDLVLLVHGYLAFAIRLGSLGLLEEPRRLLEGDIAVKILNAILEQPRVKRL